MYSPILARGCILTWKALQLNNYNSLVAGNYLQIAIHIHHVDSCKVKHSYQIYKKILM